MQLFEVIPVRLWAAGLELQASGCTGVAAEKSSGFSQQFAIIRTSNLLRIPKIFTFTKSFSLKKKKSQASSST